MISVSYNISTVIRQNLQDIEETRRDILLTVLPLQNSQFLRWETMIDRIYWSLRIQKQEISKKEIISLLATPGKHLRHRKIEEVVWGYKRTMEHIQLHWLANDKQVTVELLEELGATFAATKVRNQQKDILALLAYLQHSPEHPVILASIALAQCLKLTPFTDMNEYISWLVAYLYLYRAGYNIGDFLGLEQGFGKNLSDWRARIAYAQQHENLTVWLEYSSHIIREQLISVKEAVAEASSLSTISQPNVFWRLTDRQKEILLLMDQPGVRMTNKKIQRGWKISPITASRELAKLAAFGLVFTHGKGRSVYYTRV